MWLQIFSTSETDTIEYVAELCPRSRPSEQSRGDVQYFERSQPWLEIRRVRTVRDVLTGDAEVDRARCGVAQSGDDLEDCRLARPVRTDEPVDGSERDVEVDPSERLRVSVGLDERAGCQCAQRSLPTIK